MQQQKALHILQGRTIALVGNPNVGKSTLFNALTGLHQHTGNWPGKTVAVASGCYDFQGQRYMLIDLPGVYSLSTGSPEEEIARDYLCLENPDVTVVVADATTLERSLHLLLQVLELGLKTILCVNLMDEAGRKGIKVNIPLLGRELGIPVVASSATSGKGTKPLCLAVAEACRSEESGEAVIAVDYGPVVENALDILSGALVSSNIPRRRFLSLKLLGGEAALAQRYAGEDAPALLGAAVQEAQEKAERLLRLSGVSPERFPDLLVQKLGKRAQEICRAAVHAEENGRTLRDLKIDRILTGRRFGTLVMLLLLCLVFWLTIWGANYPSEALSGLLFSLGDFLGGLLLQAGAPGWLHGFLIMGMYRTLAWVVSVMLPPMAIFFPLFTLLEDLGYLPRIAFNLDHAFCRCGACGKQALSMCMGFGCNAAGVIGCRIISSPRERLIAILTNCLVPCNGRFPLLITMISLFFCSGVLFPFDSLLSALMLTGVILLGIGLTFAVSWLLSKTVLRGLPSSFTLELPPYRRPQILKVLIRSVLDRTLFVLGRAAAVALPAGGIIWLLANLQLGGGSLLQHCAGFLDPFARWMGMDGFILLAFILSLPANEMVLPVILMSYLSAGHMVEMESLQSLRLLLVENGWTAVTACCVMLFSLAHFPCATTLWTMKKETGSLRWTLLGFFLPTIIGMGLCMLVHALFS